MYWHVDGIQIGSKTSSVPSNFSSASSAPLLFGNKNKFGEILFFRTALSEKDRQSVESHLAMKFGMTGELPANHLFNNYTGWSMGRDEAVNSISTIYGVGEKIRQLILLICPQPVNGTTSYPHMVMDTEKYISMEMKLAPPK